MPFIQGHGDRIIYHVFENERREKVSERENENIGMKGGKVLRAEDAFE